MKKIIFFLALFITSQAQAQVNIDQMIEAPGGAYIIFTDDGSDYPLPGIQEYHKWKDLHLIDTLMIQGGDSLCISLFRDSIPALCVQIPCCEAAVCIDTFYQNEAMDSLFLVECDGDTTFFPVGGSGEDLNGHFSPENEGAQIMITGATLPDDGLFYDNNLNASYWQWDPLYGRVLNYSPLDEVQVAIANSSFDARIELAADNTFLLAAVLGGEFHISDGAVYPFTIEASTTVNNSLRIQADGDVQAADYPNSRDDGTPTNVLGTDANGVLQSYPATDLPFDPSNTNELQTLDVSGTGPTITLDLSGDASDPTVTGAGATAVTASGNAITVTTSTESIQDAVAGLLTGTQTGITVTYDDAGNMWDFVATGGAGWVIDADDADTETITTNTVKWEGGVGIVTDYVPASDKVTMIVDGDEFTTVVTTETDDYLLMHDENGGSADVLEKILVTDFIADNAADIADGNGMWTLSNDATDIAVDQVKIPAAGHLEFYDGSEHDLYIDAANDKIGINDNTPDATLDIHSAGVIDCIIEDLSNHADLDLEGNEEGASSAGVIRIRNTDAQIGTDYLLASITGQKNSATVVGGKLMFAIGYDASSNTDGVLELGSREGSATDGYVAVTGGLRYKWVDEPGTTYTLTTGDYGLRWTGTGSKTATLPGITSGNRGQFFTIFNDAGSGDVTITASGGATITGDNILSPGESCRVEAASTTDWIISN